MDIIKDAINATANADITVTRNRPCRRETTSAHAADSSNSRTPIPPTDNVGQYTPVDARAMDNMLVGKDGLEREWRMKLPLAPRGPLATGMVKIASPPVYRVSFDDSVEYTQCLRLAQRATLDLRPVATVLTNDKLSRG